MTEHPTRHGAAGGDAIRWRGLSGTVLGLVIPACLWAQNPASVWISAPDSKVVAGSSLALTLVARDSGGRALANPNCSWSATGNNPFTVDSGGIVTARSLGIGDITAACGNARNTVRLQSVPSAITVAPVDIEIVVGDQVSYTAQALDVNGNPIPNTPISWNVIGEDGNNTASVFVSQNGTLTSVGVGRFTVRATFSYNPPPNGQPGAGPGQFIPQFYGRTHVTVRPAKTYKLTRLASTGDRRQFFQLRPRRSQIAVSASGKVAFNASLEGYATGMFLYDGQPRMVAAAGYPGDVPGTMIWDFDEPAINRQGEIFGSMGYWGIGTGLVWITPGGVPRYVLQDGSTVYDIRNIFASRLALSDSGVAVFRGTLLNPGARVRTSGLFSISTDGSINLLFESVQALDKLPAGWNFTNEFATDNAQNVAFSVANAGLQTIYRLDSSGNARRIAGAGDRMDNRDVRTVRNPILSPNGDLGLIVDFTTGPSRMLLCPGADCTKAFTYDSGDIRAIYQINDHGQAVVYANAGSGPGIHVWDGKSNPKAIFLEGKLSPTGAVYSGFQSAGIASNGDVIAQARGATNLFLIVRASGSQRTTLAQAGDFVTGLAGATFANIALGAKTGPAHLLVGGNRNNVFEASLTGVIPRLLAGDRLPAGGWFEANYNVRKLPSGEIMAATDDSLHLVTANSANVLKTFPSLMDGVNTNSPFLFTGNSNGMIATVHGTQSNIQRLMTAQNGQWRQAAWIGSTNNAFRTVSPSGGNFDAVNDLWVTDDGIVYANMRVNGGPSGAFLYDGNTWTNIAVVGDTIDSRALQAVNEIHVGGSHIYARFQLSNSQAIYEYTGGGWKRIIGVSDNSPTGNIINNVGAFDANRLGQVAARIDSGGAVQLVVIDGSQVRVVQDFNAAAETGEWLRDPIMIDFRDDGRIFFTVRSYTDQFTLYEADPLS